MVASLYTAEAELLAGLELVVQLVVVLVHVLQEVRSQGQWEWMRKIRVDHNNYAIAHLHQMSGNDSTLTVAHLKWTVTTLSKLGC